MKKSILFFVIALLFQTIGYAQELVCEAPHFNLSKMKQALNSLPKNEKFLNLKKVTSQTLHTYDSYYADVYKTFTQIQTELLGYQAITLEFEAGDRINTDRFSAMIILGNEVIEDIMTNSAYEDSKSLMDFVIAHEFSHLIQDFVDPEFPLDKTKYAMYETDNLEHTEVDAYALLILKMLKLPLPKSQDVSRLLAKMDSVKRDFWHQRQNPQSFLQRKACEGEMRTDLIQKYGKKSKLFTRFNLF